MVVYGVTGQSVLDGLLNGVDLKRIGDYVAQVAWIESLLPGALNIIENTIGRDFNFHAEDVVTLNGQGGDQIQVWADDATLCSPIVSVAQVKVYDVPVAIDQFFVQRQQGVVGWRKCRPNPTSYFGFDVQSRVRWWGMFPRDYQNVEITLDWGFATPPVAIQEALKMSVSCFALSTYGAGSSAGLRAKRIEDYEEVYGNGPYLEQVKSWSVMAMSMLKNYRTGRAPLAA